MEKLAPKTGTLDKLITKPADIAKVLAGEKVATRRSGRFADVGDTWTLDGQELIMKDVYRQMLGEVSDADAKMEGYENLDGYKESILSLHPGMKWVPEMKVWVHEYGLNN